MSELRWNPLLRTWTMIAANRKNRPHMPKDWCPFCPGSGRVPEDYDIYVYDNDFPALTPFPEAPAVGDCGPYRVMENYGKCEVILYSPQHNTTLSQLSTEHILKLIGVWTDRFRALSQDTGIKYIFTFENRGEEVGVTMPHPHGQLYAYPFVPQKLQVELESCREYKSEKGRCLLCDMNKEEKDLGDRVVAENDSFIAYIPFFTDYPYGVFIVSKAHKGNFTQFDDNEKNDLAYMLKNITGAFDRLFDRPFPYMMCIHQNPVNTEEYADWEEYYHFHIEFYPPLREANKIKYYASSEMGAWAAANPSAPEETAAALRAACESFVNEQPVKEGR